MTPKRFIYLGFSALLLAGCDQIEMEPKSNPSSDPNFSRFEVACQDAIKMRLRSPSSFQLAEMTDISEAIVFSEEEKADVEARRSRLYQKMQTSDLTLEESLELSELALLVDGIRKAEDGEGPRLLSIIVEYDAQNSFGAMIRGTEICEYEATHGTFSEYADAEDVLVGGEEYMDWLISQVP